MSAEKMPECEEIPKEMVVKRKLEVSTQPSYEYAFQSFETDLRKLLVRVTGQTDTTNISRVKIKVVTKQAGLHRFSDYTPRLRVLILDGSCVDSLRDLGSSLRHLESLSVVRCSLESLDGLWGFRSLNSLVARENFIKDPSPCSGVHKLEKLDLCNNEIDDSYSFAFLRNCKHLRCLDVAGNRFDDYQDIITSLIPQLEILDGEIINAVDAAQVDSGEESDLTSENEELIFRSIDADNPELPTNEQGADFAINKTIEFPHQSCPQELGAGDDLPVARQSIVIHAKEIMKNRNEERDLDPSSSSIFLMTNDFDSMSLIDTSARNVEYFHHNLETMPSKLTSGRAICGNLAASLRARNLSKNPFTLRAARVESSVDDNKDPKE